MGYFHIHFRDMCMSRYRLIFYRYLLYMCNFLITGSDIGLQENNFLENNEKRRYQDIFQRIEYPLGSKSSLGKWRVCAMQSQHFNMEKVSLIKKIVV